jgi:HPt (histidine-containing phosphotransfer) domain-containing protein
MMSMNQGMAPEATPAIAVRMDTAPIGRPVDLVFLARQTFGDRLLEAEVLGLFRAQAPRLFADLEAASGDERRRIAHRISGAARSIGAWQVAEAASAVEAGTTVDLDALKGAIGQAISFILSLTAPDQTARRSVA